MLFSSQVKKLAGKIVFLQGERENQRGKLGGGGREKEKASACVNVKINHRITTW